LFTTMKNSIFAHEKVNAGRQDELDLAKFLNICCLAYIHTIIACTPEEGLLTGIPYLFDSIIGGPLSAPVFLFAMGVGVAYTRRQTPGDLARRALRLGIVSYALNICRFLIPFLVGFLITGDREQYITPLPYTVLGNDVLQFAAICMLLIALFLRLRLTDGTILLISLALSVLGTVLRGVDTGSVMGNILLGYLIGTEDSAQMLHSFFPVLNWLIVPVSGFLFGKRLLLVKDKDRFYRVLSLICVPLAAIYFFVGIVTTSGMFGEGQFCYYHISTPDVMAAICSAMGCFGLCHMIVSFLPSGAKNVIREVSANVTSIYCIHWVLLSFTICVVLYIWRGTQLLPLTMSMLLATVVCIVSILLARAWKKIKRHSAQGGIR